MDANPSTNPYHPGDPLAPFAGRQAELARLDQYLKDAIPSGALTFLGRRWLGKTALLRRFESVFDDQYLSLYLPLKLTPLDSENALLQAIIDGVGHALAMRDITLSRIPTPEPDTVILRGWFADTWLPGVLHILRTNRKLVLLLDDAHVWQDAESGDGWPGDTFDFFHDLLQQHPQFKMVLTFAAEREDTLNRLNPLVSAAQIIRLTYLSLDATAWLLRYSGLYSVPDEGVNLVQRATGGHPQLLQRFAAHIYQYYDTHPGERTIPPEVIRTLMPGVYHVSAEVLNDIWAESADTEQLVLMAFSHLRYEDPLRAITAETIATWVIDSDYPLDRTTIHAALRGLEYREVLAHRGGGLELTSNFLQTWLLENTPRAVTAPSAAPSRWRTPAIIAGLILVALVIALLISLSNTPQTPDAATAVPGPTVTLSQ